MTDDGLFTQLRAYAQQLDELPAAPRLAPVVATGWRPPRWTRREWIALAAAVAVLVIIATVRIAGQASDSTPSVSTGGATTVTRVWTRNLGAPAQLALNAPNDTTIVTTNGGTAGLVRLTALDRQSGHERWHRVVYGTVTATVAGDRLVVVRGDGQVALYSTATGRPRWAVNTGAVPSTEPANPPLITDRVAYLSTYDGLLALDLESHFTLWRQALSGAPTATPVFHDGKVYVTVRFAGVTPQVGFAALDARTGAVVSHFELAGTLISPPAVDDQFVVASVANGDLSRGWVLDTTRFVTRGAVGVGPKVFPPVIQAQPVVVGGMVIVVARDGTVAGSAPATATSALDLRWQTNLGESQLPTIARYGSGLLVAAGEVAMLRLEGTTVWTAPVRDAYFPAPAAGGLVVAVSRTDGRLYVLDARDGHVVTTVKDGTSQTGVTLHRDGIVTASQTGVVTGYRVTRR